MITSSPVTIAGQCGHCGLFHGTMPCSRIKSIEYHLNGTIKRIEYHDPAPIPVAACPSPAPTGTQDRP